MIYIGECRTSSGQAELYDTRISDVSSTMLLTLYCRALEGRSKNPILNDPKAVEITREIDKELSGSRDKFYKRLVSGRLDPKLVVHIALRARKYDEYARSFLQRAPDGVVVNIGCGLDTRFWRVDNGKVAFYDLDLPEVIEIRKRFLGETERYHFIAASVFDRAWMARLLEREKGPFLFLAEGVFMYLPAADVKSLVVELQSRFPGSELVCEVVSDFWVRRPMSWLVSFKLQKEQRLGKGAVFHFGLKRSDEMEAWSPGIRLLDDWSYFDAEEKRLGWLRVFRHFEFLKKTQYTVHYRLDKVGP